MMGQIVTAPAFVGRDYSDPLRVRQKPLPTIGSWGIVLIPNGDIRNATWAFTTEPSLANALNYTGDATDPFMDYESHFSGDWYLLDGKGNFARQFADGSSLIMAATSGLPTIYRNIVDEKQNQIKQEFKRSERIPNPPSGFYALFDHISGTTFSVNPSGNFAVSGASGTSGIPSASGSITFGGSTFSIDASGNFLVSGAAGATATINFGQSQIIVDASGKVSINLTGSETLNISQGGGSPSDFLVLVSKFLTAFNAHTHKGVTSGGAISGTPTTNLAAGDVKSAAVDISN